MVELERQLDMDEVPGASAVAGILLRLAKRFE